MADHLTTLKRYQMHSFRNFFLLLLFTYSISLQAQIKKESEEKPYIEVIGHAEQEIVPDEIFVSIFIKEKYIGREKLTIDQQEVKLKLSLKGINVDLKNLYLSDAVSDYVRVRWRTKDVLTKKAYTLKVSSAFQLGQVFEELDKLEITEASIEKVNHSKIDSLKKEVRILAIKAAKTKAEYLLDAIGEHIGKAVIIEEKENAYLDHRSINSIQSLNIRGSRSSEDAYYIDGEKEDVVQFQKIKIQSAIIVRFAIQ